MAATARTDPPRDPAMVELDAMAARLEAMAASLRSRTVPAPRPEPLSVQLARLAHRLEHRDALDPHDSALLALAAARLARPVSPLPDGWRIDRCERLSDVLTSDVTFTLRDSDGVVMAAPRAVEDRRAGEWFVNVGLQRNGQDPIEARARAAALLMAADEVEARNAERRR